MAASIFDDKSVQPDAARLATALAKSAKLWEKIKSHLAENYGPLAYEWKFYGQKSGWTMKVLRRKRNLFFLTPLAGSFRIAFVFGDKAVAAVEKSDLPDAIKETLRSAKKYVEGRGLRMEVASADDVKNIIKLAAIKFTH